MADDRLPFGTRLSDIGKEQVNAPTETKAEPEIKNEPEVVNDGKIEPPKVEQKTETKTEPTKVTWLEEANKFYKTDFKSPEDFGKVFDKAKKVDEYEPKIKGYEESENKYKQQLQELQSSLNPLNYFSSQESYVAEQLRKQHPDKSPAILHDVVTSDNKRMDDLEVLIKNQMLETPNLIGGENGAREYILDKYGVDTSLPKEEWSITVQNKIRIEADQKRKEWDKLKSEVVLPNVATPEQREAERVRLQEEKKIKITPLKETFSKFDKFTETIEDGKVFDFNVPDEYKQKLPDMFEAYFVQAGLEPNKENLDAMEDLKQALLLKNHFKQIYKTIEGDVETRMKAERDRLLNNVNPTNTQSANEVGESDKDKFSNEQGLGKFFNRK
jgi:hypothetical protein